MGIMSIDMYHFNILACHGHFLIVKDNLMNLHQGKKSGLIWSILLLSTLSVEAGTMGEARLAPYDQHLEFSAAGGLSWYNVPNTDLIISAYETDRDHVHHHSTDGAWKVGVGYSLFEEKLSQWPYFSHLLFEANVYQSFTTLKGDVWQFGLPEFNNYNFRAPVTSTRLMFDVKPEFFAWNSISPYAILGAGAVWNTLSYREQVTGVGIPAGSALLLSKHTTSHFAWEAGAGFSVSLSNRLSATAEYVYAFLGHGFPGHHPANGVNLAKAPHFSLQTQNLLFGLSLKL